MRRIYQSLTDLFRGTGTARQVPGGQAEFLRVPFGDRFPIDVLPTAWQAVQYADVPRGGSLVVLGLGPIGDRRTRTEP